MALGANLELCISPFLQRVGGNFGGEGDVSAGEIEEIRFDGRL